jgi:methyl-accepting chemotaxis protein
MLSLRLAYRAPTLINEDLFMLSKENSLRLRAKILGLLGSGIISVGLIAFYSLTILSDKIDKYDSLVQVESNASTQVDNININFKRQIQEWKNVILRGHNSTDREKYWQRFLQLQTVIQRDAQGFSRFDIAPQYLHQMRDFRAQHAGLLAKYQQGLQSFLASDFSHIQADTLVRGIDRAPTQLLERLAKDMHDSTILHSEQISKAAASSMFNASVAILLAIIFCGITSSWFMNSKVVTPLTLLIEHLDAVSHGDYSTQLLLDRSDEIGSMSGAIELLRKNLVGISAELSSTQTDLDQVSYSLQDSAAAISQGVREQNLGTDQVTTAMQQMTQKGEQVKLSANKASDAAQSVNTAAQSSQNVMQQTIASITLSAKQIQDTSEVIQKLDEDAQNVSSVIEVIQSIAEQTNLLALNAAIEAARAGEQGRGFAVVADEVRTLASRTQKSTEEIKTIVGNLQAGAQNAVKAIEQGDSQSKASADKVLEADNEIQKVTAAIGQISELNQQISIAIAEQADVSSQVVDRLDELGQIAKTNHIHAESCSEDNVTLGRVKKQMDGTIAKLQGTS